MLEFETGSQWDALDIRFFMEQESYRTGGQGFEAGRIEEMRILGAYYRALSSIFFDDDNSSTVNIDLK